MDADYETGNMGHRPRVKGGYFPVPPIDSGQDYRGEMLSVMAGMGIEVEKHHHEVAAAQHELGMKFDALMRNADKMQIYKYAVHQVAHAYGKTATFMPKPVYGDNGTGMHVHMSIWKDGKPQFAGNEYAGLSESCLYYIGGIIKHAKALNAFTNPPPTHTSVWCQGLKHRCCLRILPVTGQLHAEFRTVLLPTRSVLKSGSLTRPQIRICALQQC